MAGFWRPPSGGAQGHLPPPRYATFPLEIFSTPSEKCLSQKNLNPPPLKFFNHRKFLNSSPSIISQPPLKNFHPPPKKNFSPPPPKIFQPPPEIFSTLLENISISKNMLTGNPTSPPPPPRIPFYLFYFYFYLFSFTFQKNLKIL